MADFGLLGQTLGHSWSPQIHRALGGYDYALFPVPPEKLAAFLQTTPCRGLNVTIPYKKAVLPYCASLSPVAQRLGCVNTMRRTPAGWYGDNTDYAGFCTLARQANVQGLHSLVLGSGGAGSMAAMALRDLGAARVDIVSRRGTINYENLPHTAQLIVNATPVGMYPDCDHAPLSLQAFPDCRAVIDLIYHPLRTRLLLEAQALGIPAFGGLPMLVVQAQHAAAQFCTRPIDDGKAAQVLADLQRQMENIVLIGMPGCGKSTMGAGVAQALGRPFWDSDAILAERFGPIPALLSARGEDGFRVLETQVLSELGKRSGCVIATGGGAVTRPENYPLLRQNGRILRLRRPLDQLATEGRPLSAALSRLEAEREPLYRRWAEREIDNLGAPEDTVRAILEVIA